MNLRDKRLWIAVVFVTVGVIVGLIISSSFNFFSKGYSETKISKEAIDLLTKIDDATSEVAVSVKPAVVNISSTTTVRMRSMRSPFQDDPFFREFFGDSFRSFEKPREFKQSGMGSGVIVDKEGYILTNNHVVKDADEIKVTLSNKKVYKGKVIGTDPKTDIAVIKINDSNLPILKIGNSDQLKVGARVIAIGNPFGLNQTVTTGIISATGRADVGIADYEDFIQTDAPINPGNSGGALVNIRGELIGINTAILSSSGGYQGVGFAVPSNMAKVVMDSLIKKGKVVRGWLGVSIQPITPELAREFGLKEEKGILISDVIHNSPAEQAGLQRGDILTEFDGKEMRDPSQLKNLVANTQPGKEVVVKYVRNGKINTAKVLIKELSAEAQSSTTFENLLKGISVQDITPDIRRDLNLPPRVTGVVITNVRDDSPAGEVLSRGDIIVEVNKKKIDNVRDYDSMRSRIKSDQRLLILIYRNGSTMYITL